jgi:hypothetical protein
MIAIQPFVIERTYNAPIEKVWIALTDKGQMKKWYFDLAEFKPVVGFELFSEGDKTRLKLTHEGLETFPANNPDFAKQSFTDGWTMLIGTLLKDFVDQNNL